MEVEIINIRRLASQVMGNDMVPLYSDSGSTRINLLRDFLLYDAFQKPECRWVFVVLDSALVIGLVSSHTKLVALYQAIHDKSIRCMFFRTNMQFVRMLDAAAERKDILCAGQINFQRGIPFADELQAAITWESSTYGSFAPGSPLHNVELNREVTDTVACLCMNGTLEYIASSDDHLRRRIAAYAYEH